MSGIFDSEKLKKCTGITEMSVRVSPKSAGKPLAYFAVFKKHIGFYPTPTGIDEFKKDLSAYKQGKGSVQFPLDKPVPFELIKRMVQFRKSDKCYLSKM